ncbi:MAG: transporter substrate-binding domain-containing protein [Lachnospiraceae bacterium]
MNRKKVIAFLMALVFVLASLSGCGSSNTEEADTKAEDTKETDAEEGDTSEAPIKVSIGIGNAYSPFCYLDENGEQAGYDYEVLLAVEELVSDKYEFVYNGDAFENILIGLDTGTYDIAVHHYGYTEERAENYLYAKEADMYYGNFVIGYKAGRTDITDLKSLAGKAVVVSTGSMAETLVLNWNEENPDDEVKIEYATDAETRYSGLENGLYDAIIMASYDINVFNSQYDNFLEISDYKVTADDYDSGTYFVYSKGSEDLQEDIDEAIAELRENGTLASLSETLLGGDYSVNPNDN